MQAILTEAECVILWSVNIQGAPSETKQNQVMEPVIGAGTKNLGSAHTALPRPHRLGASVAAAVGSEGEGVEMTSSIDFSNIQGK